MRDIVLILHDIRSCHNVGSLLRTADGFGVSHVYFSGYTPYPPLAADDPRLPHLAQKLGRQIAKTALGAERTVPWSVADSIESVLAQLRTNGYHLVGLEQATKAVALPDYRPTPKTALLVGREVEGIDPALLASLDTTVEIPMFGQKESFNVAQATAVALYQLQLAK